MNGEVAVEVWRSLDDRFPKKSIKKHQVFDSLRMIENPFLIFAMVEMKLALVDAGSQVSPGALLGTMLVESAQVGGDAGMEPTDKVIEYFFLATDLFMEIVLGLEAVFFIDEFPDIGAVVVSERLDVGLDIEVFTTIIGFVLDVPDPAILDDFSFVLPHVLIMNMRGHLLRVRPELWNIGIVASANGAAFTLANPPHDSQLALLIYVQPNDPEVFGLYKFLEDWSSPLVHILEGILPAEGHPLDDFQAYEE